MYTIALLVLVGFVAASVSSLALNLVPAIEKVPFLGKPEVFMTLVSILFVWLGDVSVLGAFGMGSSAQWVDVIGSGIAVAATYSVVQSTVDSFNR
jgi:hypothetical protein